MTDYEPAATLGRKASAVSSMKLRLGVRQSSETKSRRMRLVRSKANDLWSDQEKWVISKFAASETADQLLLRLPNRSKKAILAMRNRMGNYRV